ncbi:phage major tail tube protein [Cronobacter muytjensii]|uniref:phage major tail tube protein n=1 Tax=Cronobacter muytjensii TaxID=413501 RepID=UPI002DC010E8|nr:phage major tail tube protein [Cronobacter muytjensii]MEB8638663.1 phage major tail tube protein [Cronobacter muytjensii]
MADANVYRAFALFVQGRRICACTEYTPTDLKITEGVFKSGSMDTGITMDDGMEPMSTSFKVSGSDADVMGCFGFIPGKKVRFEIRSAFTDTNASQWEQVDTYDGIITAITDDPRGIDSKTAAGQTVNVAPRYFKRVQNGKEIYEIDPIQCIRRINGVNVLETVKNILRIN